MPTETKQLPEWAEEWVRGRCGCGARLVRPFCYCSGHVVCVESGWPVDRCDRAALTTTQGDGNDRQEGTP